MFAEKCSKYGNIIIDAQKGKSYSASPFEGVASSLHFDDLMRNLEELILVPFK